MTITLSQINGGSVTLISLQALVIALGLPLCFILLLVTIGLYKTLKHDPFITHRPKPIYESNLNLFFNSSIISSWSGYYTDIR